MATLIKLLLSAFIIAGLATSIYLLWQRQPKVKTESESPQLQTIVKSDESQKDGRQTFLLSPTENEIQISQDLKISGKTKESGNVLIISNSLQKVISTKEDGTFDTVIKIPTGLSIFNIVSLNTKYEELQKVSLPVYFPKTINEKALNFKSGTVKKIFNNTITLSLADSAEQDIKTASPTDYKILTGPNLNATNAVEKDIRVGDYIVAIGQNQNKILSATNIEIYRDNKPSLNKSYALAKIVTPVKSNSFTAVNGENKVQQYSIDKNSQVLENENIANVSSIKKDRDALIIFSETDDKTYANYIQLY